MRRRKINPTPDQLAIRDYQAMLYIEDYYTTHQAVPTVRDVMAALAMSLGGAHDLLDRLVDYGYLQRGRKNCRRNLRILKSVRTGLPVAAHWATLYAETAAPMSDAAPYVPGPLFHLYTLNATEQQALDFIADDTETHGQPPTMDDIQAAIGFHSQSDTQDLLLRLEVDEWLEYDPEATSRHWRVRK